MEENSQYKRPDPPDWLSRDLIQNCLTKSKNYHESTLIKFEVDYGCSPCYTFGSGLFRAYLTLRDKQNSEKYASIFIKCIPTDTNKDYLPGLIKGCRKEILVFSKVINEVNSLLESIGSFDSITAQWIGSGEVPTHFLMIEDLSAASYQMAKKREGLDLQHSVLVMRLIAKYHAATAVILEKNMIVVEDFKECTKYVSGNDRGLRKIISFIVPVIVDNLTKRSNVPPRLIDEIRKLGETLPDTLEKLTQFKPNRFNVLIHGDLWANNLMFRYSNGEIMGVKFIDFQESFVSSPIYDVLFYIYSSLKEEVLINNFDFLIDEYYNTLCKTLNTLQYDGMPYSVEDLKNDVKEYMILDKFLTVFVTAVALASEDSSLPFEGTSRGHLDFFTVVYSNPVYISKLERRLLFLSERGLL